MNPIWGWALAALALVTGWWAYGWQGVVVSLTVVVFWLLLQFSRALRAMKNAADAPIGHVPSAVMLHTKLRVGMTLLQVIAQTRSLGRRVAEVPETWAWEDEGGAGLTLVFEGARLARWTLTRTDEMPTPAASP
jgi:hypothetical protein